MNKLLLTILLIFIFSISYSQSKKPVMHSLVAPVTENLTLPISKAKTANAEVKPEKFTRNVNGRAVEYIPIGQSPNALATYHNSRTYLWADPTTNSVVFTHSVNTGGDAINIGYDVSIDKGNTWVSNNQIDYNGSSNIAQGGILNPPGNTNPDNAIYTFLSNYYDGSPSNISNYLVGCNILNNISTPQFEYKNIINDSTFIRNFNNAFTITTKGEAWFAGGVYSIIDNIPLYNDQIVVGKITYLNNEIQYSEKIISYPLPLPSNINDVKIAFDPYGEIGYICIMSDDQIEPVPFTNFHPVIFKTIDGGETWSGPIQVQLGGVGGIESIKYYWPDELFENPTLYGPDYHRDSVYYSLGYSCDIVVDGLGNPHITGIIAISTWDGWFPNEGTMATWHVYSNDKGESWDATALYDNIFFEGEIGELLMYNMPYAASTLGSLIVFSWIDTDLDGAEGNTNPNIFVVGYDAIDGYYTDVDNVTELSLHWFSAYYANMSQYVFCEDNYTTIPFVFSEFTIPGDPLSEINYWYINGYDIGQFFMSNCRLVNVNENNNEPFTLSTSVYPNPSNSIVSILVNIKKPDGLSLTITNNLGQVVHQSDKYSNALAHNFYVDVSNFESGVYFYTVSVDAKSITKKMIVQ